MLIILIYELPILNKPIPNLHMKLSRHPERLNAVGLKHSKATARIRSGITHKP